MKDVVYGLAAGILGALLWAGVIYFTEYEIGWIAWGVGGLVGFAVARGNKDGSRSPTAAGTLAVIITVLSIVGGKYAGVTLVMPTDVEILDMFTVGFDEDEYVVSYLADDVVRELEAAGGTVDWPPEVDPEQAAGEADYPPDVWVEAMARWTAMTAEEQAAFRDEREADVRADIEANLPEIRAIMSRGGFFGSFSPMDLIFFGLAAVTAFGLGSGKKSKEEEVAEAYQRALKLALFRVMLAEGTIDDEQVAAAVAVYHQLTGATTTPEAMRAEAMVVRSTPQELLASLTDLAPHLDEAAREAVVRSAVVVAIADGDVGDQERILVEGIARAVGMSHERLTGLLSDLIVAS